MLVISNIPGQGSPQPSVSLSTGLHSPRAGPSLPRQGGPNHSINTIVFVVVFNYKSY